MPFVKAFGYMPKVAEITISIVRIRQLAEPNMAIEIADELLLQEEDGLVDDDSDDDTDDVDVDIEEDEEDYDEEGGEPLENPSGGSGDSEDSY